MKSVAKPLGACALVCALICGSTAAQATPVFAGSFTGVAYNSVNGTGSFDGEVVTGSFKLTAFGTGDSRSPTETNSVIGGAATSASYTMTVHVGGQMFAFDDLTWNYWLDTYYPGGGAESEVRVASQGPTGGDFAFWGNLLRSSLPDDIIEGGVDLGRSSVNFVSSSTVKGSVRLTSVAFGSGVDVVGAVPEPSSAWLVPVAIVGLCGALRRRRIGQSLVTNARA